MPLQAKHERALVGLFVLVATGLLVATLFAMSGVFGRGGRVYRAYFKNAGGLGPGSEVRYAGGPPVGRVTVVRTDPQDPSRMEIDFRVDDQVPVKMDSKAKIASLGPLGDNFLGIVPGSATAQLAPSGTVLTGMDYASFDDLTSKINNLAPQVSVLLVNLNARVTDLQETIRRVNSLLDTNNRANISASLANVRGMLAEDRPVLHSTLNNLNATSSKLAPLIDDLKKTANQANIALSHIDGTVMENRPDLRQAVSELRGTLTSTNALTDQLNGILNTNSDNLDVIIANLRDVTENLKAFTERIKTRPASLIRSSAPPEHVPGQLPKQPK
ncbi:MAG TPA: MlaD family protein [Candidatus Acidoferrales bacterium]|nr:MlaD family protein [Candidatus Acidoferrales bacterium]